MSEQTASAMAKAVGLPSLNYVSEKTGINAQTLINWRNNRPLLWSVILAGCVAVHDEEKATGTTLEAKTQAEKP